MLFGVQEKFVELPAMTEGENKALLDTSRLNHTVIENPRFRIFDLKSKFYKDSFLQEVLTLG